ncbi:MAG: cardiolipin synthase [Bacilli bacterium]|nr:cardiolipin synthase [Bacilli bacterium]
MFSKIRNILTSRIFWIGILLLLEIGLIVLFVFAIAGSMKDTFHLNDNQVAIIFIVALFIISGLVVIYIVNSHVKMAYKVAWLVVVALLPLVGCFFYLLFGNKKVTNRQRRKAKPIIELLGVNKTNPVIAKELKAENLDALKMVDYITSASGTNVYKHTKTQYYPSGEAAFPVMLKELKKAKHFIFIEYFIISPGIFWNAILDVLKKKAQAGVDVRIIYDDVGSAKYLPSSYAKKLQSYGLKVLVFNKFKPLLDVKLNNRDHRKIMVIDGVVGFSGGINLADEYINKIHPFGYWKDNAIKLEGEGVHGLTSLFLSQWILTFNTKENKLVRLTDKAYQKYFPSSLNTPSDGYVQPYGDLPYDTESVGERVYLNLIARAKKYIYISTPYLIIDDEIVNALINAAKQGIDVRILTPSHPDKKTIFMITRSHYRLLLANGVKIYEYKPGFVHMKMFVVDDIYAVVGTINLDYRSLYLHLENATFFYKSSCISAMKKDFMYCLKDGHEITYKAYHNYAAPRRFVWSLLRLFAPLF